MSDVADGVIKLDLEKFAQWVRDNYGENISPFENDPWGCARALGAAFSAEAEGVGGAAIHFHREAQRELTALKNAQAAQRRISGPFASPLRRALQLIEDAEQAKRPVYAGRLSDELSAAIAPLASALRGLELESHYGPDTRMEVSESAVTRVRGEILRLLSDERHRE